MKKIQFKNAEFVRTFVALPLKGLRHDAPMFCFVGRSNVGKSSLINHLTLTKNLAKVSCVPGKTQAINIFDIDKSIYLADLPGYGFSQTGKQLQSGWDALMGQFLIDYRPFVIVLTDGRHPLFESDKEMISWLKMHMIPYTIVATKADKLNRSELHKKTNEFLHTFGEKPLYFSVEDIIGRNQLLHKMQSYIETSKNLQETPTLAYS